MIDERKLEDLIRKVVREELNAQPRPPIVVNPAPTYPSYPNTAYPILWN